MEGQAVTHLSSGPAWVCFSSIRRARSRSYLDDVEGLDDARGAHTGEATVHERLDGLPGRVILERHGWREVEVLDCGEECFGRRFVSQRGLSGAVANKIERIRDLYLLALCLRFENTRKYEQANG